MKLKLFAIISALLFVEILSQQVTTPDGPIKGVIETTNTGKTYYAYYSIPYAKPPTGARRFQPPEATDPWTEVHDGTTEKPNICYQVYTDYEQENEDCLYMNVFTPQDPSTSGSSLPVMVNIHGGGFISGSGLVSYAAIGSMSPKYLIEGDVIFVSFNYRLGPFGFLSTGDDVIPGNNGLRDQILALKWVQRNIAAFGGDPDKVTVLGQSAGGASVGYLIISPAAKGLFSGAILESGTPLCPWSYQRDQTEITFKTASFIDSQFDTSRDSQKLLEVLQSVDAKEIDNAGTEFASWDASQDDAVYRLQMQQGFVYAPVIEQAGSDPVLSTYQYESLYSGDINKVPVLMGVCSEEGLTNLDQSIDYIFSVYDKIPGYLNPKDLHIDEDVDLWNQVGNLIHEHYAPSGSLLQDKLGGIRYYTEHDFVKASTKHAELQSAQSDVYYYQFSYSGKLAGNTEHTYPGSGNVSHVEEWMYLYWGWPLDSYSEEDQLIHKRLVRIWTNFAKYQNPTPTSDELLQNIIWPKVTPQNFQFVNIGNFSDTDLTIVQGKPKADGMAFWDNIYDSYGIRPFDTY